MGKKIVIAGGSGLVGQALQDYLRKEGHQVYVLSRKEKSDPNYYYWNPSLKKIDANAIEGTQVLINLSGQGIADSRWTEARKKELLSSRVVPTQFLFSVFQHSNTLEQYISASGINCYPLNNYDKVYKEEDAYGDDFLSHIVKEWEKSADLFQSICKVAKLRTSVVLTPTGGALATIAKPIKLYVGSPLGSGKQWMPWITITDLTRMFGHVIQQELSGTYNAIANANTNKDFTEKLAKVLHKPLVLPNVPGFVLKLVLGEMSTMVLEGIQASNEKVKAKGFTFKYKELPQALEHVLKGA
ncbi:TIGR01777 family oxidoreductase [Lishizhenia sp.]|uniref:TIGR01777 family oxidoreductase n=1 Tax=Lishizhenia sp. TaxID=2497594 RepID=UPI00299EDC2C|nr:TIGR01777 family oxidoreductase [Lishizhenia sp.]MDX1444766.1 TIGR01777 family oxidoreductase [Lishizhenia sp.]